MTNTVSPDTDTADRLARTFNRLGLTTGTGAALVWSSGTAFGTDRATLRVLIHETDKGKTIEGDRGEVERLLDTVARAGIAARQDFTLATQYGFYGNEFYRPGFYALEIDAAKIDTGALERAAFRNDPSPL